MEIEGFQEIISTLVLAKELYDSDRFDIVEKEFYDVLCYDSFYENTIGAISSVFSEFYNDYDEENESEFMLFQDDVMAEFYYLAGEYGRMNGIPHNENPYINGATSEVRRWLNFSYSLDWKLLGYTKSKRTAKKSKLLVLTSCYDFYEHDHLAFGLLKIHKWFKGKCEELRNQQKELIAA